MLSISFVYPLHITQKGEQMKRLIDFKGLYDAIRRVADKKFEGNFNMAVRFLVSEGLKNNKVKTEVEE
jgi:hypothetical protein